MDVELLKGRIRCLTRDATFRRRDHRERTEIGRAIACGEGVAYQTVLDLIAALQEQEETIDDK